MTTAAIRKKLVDYIHIANDKKVQAIYTIIEDEISTLENEWSKDFIKELDRRSKDFAKGKNKTFTWEETKAAALEKLKSRRK